VAALASDGREGPLSDQVWVTVLPPLADAGANVDASPDGSVDGTRGQAELTKEQSWLPGHANGIDGFELGLDEHRHVERY
jgi:hypothetical protein